MTHHLRKGFFGEMMMKVALATLIVAIVMALFRVIGWDNNSDHVMGYLLGGVFVLAVLIGDMEARLRRIEGEKR